jgi:hypothetical protein
MRREQRFSDHVLTHDFLEIVGTDGAARNKTQGHGERSGHTAADADHEDPPSQGTREFSALRMEKATVALNAAIAARLIKAQNLISKE